MGAARPGTRHRRLLRGAALCPSLRPLVTRHSRADRRPRHLCAHGPQMVRATYRVLQTQSRVLQSRVPGKGAVSAALASKPSIEARDSLILRTNLLLNLDFRGGASFDALKPKFRENPSGSRKKMVANWLTGTIFLVNLRPS